MPFLEQNSAYNSLNFTLPTRWLDCDPSTYTTGQTMVAALVCPSEVNERRSTTASSDPGSYAPGYWSATYAWNSGTWWPRSKAWDGVFGRSIMDDPTVDPPLGSIGMNGLTDGTSNTLLVAEVAAGPVLPGSPRTKVSDCYSVTGVDGSSTVQQATAACNAVPWTTGPIPWGGTWRYKGFTWLEGSIWRNWFNTIRTPNQTCCTMDSVSWWYIMKPASSYHPGGVNAAMADGSVKFFKESVAQPVWMGLGTRAGGEVLSADSY